MHEKEGLDGKAVVSVVLGGLSFTTPLIGFPLAVIGIITSRIAKKEIVQTEKSVRGIELAAAGLIISIAGAVYQAYHIFELFLL